MDKIRKFLIRNSEIIIDFIYYLYFIIAIGVKIFYLQFTTGLNINEAYLNSLNQNTMRAAFSIILLIFSVIFLLFKKRRNGVLFVVNLILSIIFIGDTLYYRYYQVPLSISLIYQLGVVGDVKESIVSLYRLKDIVFFIDLPIYFIIFFTKRFMKKNYKLSTVKRRYEIPVAILMIIISTILFKSCYTKASNISMYGFDRNLVAKDLSILYYHNYDIKNFIKDEFERKKSLTAEENQLISDYFNNKTKIENPEYKGIAKDRNLIVIQVEALQSFVIENSINDQEITPFINKLINESVYMDNIYNQVAGGNTSDAEFVVNNSLYPIYFGSAYFRYPNNYYYSLANALKDKEYKTYAAHAYKASFWNRQNFYRNAGFDKFFSMNNYKSVDNIGLGISDEAFFDQTIDMIDLNDNFYLFNVTLSSHHPYDAFTGMDNLDVGKYAGKQLGNYFKAAKYADNALEKLFEKLKESGLYDNSIIVIYGDHSAIFEDQADNLCEYMNIEFNEFNWKKLQKVPAIIHVPGLNLVKRVDSIGGQIDILPTVANLMDLDLPYMMGKDMLNIPEDSNYVVFRYRTFISDDYMVADSGKFYDMKTGEVIDSEIYTEDLNNKLLELKISDTIINKDYFKKIKGK